MRKLVSFGIAVLFSLRYGRAHSAPPSKRRVVPYALKYLSRYQPPKNPYRLFTPPISSLMRDLVPFGIAVLFSTLQLGSFRLTF